MKSTFRAWLSDRSEQKLITKPWNSTKSIKVFFSSFRESHFLTCKEMSSQLGIMNKLSKRNLWTAPSKEQYLPAYVKMLSDQYLAGPSPRSLQPVKVSISLPIEISLRKLTYICSRPKKMQSYFFNLTFEMNWGDGKELRLASTSKLFWWEVFIFYFIGFANII